MAKVLKPERMDRCTGCGLCELMASRVARGEISFSDSFVQIKQVKSGEPRFKAVVDYGQKTDYKQVRDVCPENCFDIGEE
jgi:NAD-dependent dihydropyrimidine dehydrogenase PreA subunit